MIRFILTLAALAMVSALYLYFKIPAVLQYAAQMVVDASKLDILSVDITACDETSFELSMESRISNTGPIPATIQSMTLSMFSNSSRCEFADVRLPTITAQPGGVICKVVGQRVQILDYETFHVFNRNLVLQAELPITVRGFSTLTIAGLVSTTIQYNKTCIIKGFDGVNIKPLETRKHSRSLVRGNPAEIEVDVSITSESRVSIDMGVVHVAISHEGGGGEITIANLEARVRLTPGDNRVTWLGKMDVGDMVKHPMRSTSFFRRDLKKDEDVTAVVLGVGSEQCRWLSRTVREMRSPIQMESTMRDILRSVR